MDRQKHSVVSELYWVAFFLQGFLLETSVTTQWVRNGYSACAVKWNLTCDISLLMKKQDIKQGALDDSNTQNALLKLAFLSDRLFSVADSKIKRSFEIYYKFLLPSHFHIHLVITPCFTIQNLKSNLIYSSFPASCCFISFLFFLLLAPAFLFFPSC